MTFLHMLPRDGTVNGSLKTATNTCLRAHTNI
jgi:hypothetical protein